jgi:hypothetical protein
MGAAYVTSSLQSIGGGGGRPPGNGVGGAGGGGHAIGGACAGGGTLRSGGYADEDYDEDFEEDLEEDLEDAQDDAPAATYGRAQDGANGRPYAPPRQPAPQRLAERSSSTGAQDDDDASDEREATLRQANQQAAARSMAHAEAHQQRLLELARAAMQWNGPAVDAPATARVAPYAAGGSADEVPEELSGTGYAAASGTSYAAANGGGVGGGGGGGGGPAGGGAFGAVRHAALKERCRQLLGDVFEPVYQYLRGARKGSVDDKEVRRTLLSIVGPKRLNDCMCVDELIFIESNA